MSRVLGLFALLACVWCRADSALALDDTTPTLRFGARGGLSGSLPLGDVRGSAAGDDEMIPALWVDLEPLTFDVGAFWGAAAFARFGLTGGVDPDVIDQALDPTRRTGKSLGAPEPTLLELGLLARYFPWGDGTWRPYVSLGLGYATLGARYNTTSALAASLGPSAGASPFASSAESHLHRHRGIVAPLGVGLRYDVRFEAFGSEVRAPIAIELRYAHNFWLELQRKPSLETSPDVLVGERPFLDWLALAVTVGFLR